MGKLIFAVFAILLSACTGCDEPAHSHCIDCGWADAQNTTPEVCNPLTQAGCATGEKCTWLLDALMPQYVGHIGCAPDGIKNVGDSCAYGAAGATGYDDCKKGTVCGNYRGGAGTCKVVCDAQGGTPTCDAQHVCVTYSGLFSTGDTTPPAGGVCDTACNPLADNDFDGSGSSSRKTGSACGSAAGVGCYGYPSYGTPPATGWSCTSDINAAEAQPIGLRHRVSCGVDNNCADPGPQIYVNSCNQGHLPLLYEQSGSTTVICVAMCKPKNCFAGNCGTNNENRLGEAPHRCNGVDRVGTFNTAPNGEQCQFMWWREISDNDEFLPSPTSDSVGFCFDHSKYRYDSNGDMKIDNTDATMPACQDLPDGFGSGSAFGAADLGCVDSSRVDTMLATGKEMRGHVIDLPRPLYRAMRNERP